MRDLTIFVFTSALNEDDLARTVESAYSNARIPSRIYFGICEQRTDRKFANIKQQNVKKVEVTYRHPRDIPFGLGMGRLTALLLHENQDFGLWIDAHTIFDKDWDVSLLRDMTTIERAHARSLISVRPKWYEWVDKGIVKYDTMSHFGLMIEEGSAHHYIVPKRPEGEPIAEKYYEHYLVAGAFIFSRLALFKEVMPDPLIAFGGEEHAFALRACTRRYKIFSIPDSHMYHLGKAHHAFEEDEVFEGTRPWKSLTPFSYGFNRPAIDFESDFNDLNGRVMKVLTGKILGEWGAPNIEAYEKYIKNLGHDYRKV
jgi:hypothetical protein